MRRSLIPASALMAVALSCAPAKMITMPYEPLPAPEFGSGPVDVIRDLETPGQLPPLHTVRLPEGDLEYRFGFVGHMALGGTNTLVRVTRSDGVARGEVWCERLAWELKDSAGRMPRQIARTALEHRPDWGAIADSITAIGLMGYVPGVLPSGPGLIPRESTDRPSLLFEGRVGREYRSFGMTSHTAADRAVWERVSNAIRSVWNGQQWACGELALAEGERDPHSTTKWRVRPDSGWRP